MIQNVYSKNRFVARKHTFEDLDNKEKLAEVVSESNILVNATRAGMAPLENVIPVPEERLRPELAVADVVYNLLETLLVKKEKFFSEA